VNHNTTICVEGFPRSGNTFLFALCTQLTDGEKIAHHLHCSAQLKEGMRRAIPVLFVARSPLDAIASYVIREEIPIHRGVRHYLQLYKFASANRSNLVIIPFKEMVNQPQRLADTIARMLGVETREVNMDRLKNDVYAMDVADHGNADVDPMKVGLPSKERDELKQRLMNRLTSEFAGELTECEILYKITLG